MLLVAFLICLVPASLGRSSGPPIGSFPSLCVDMIPAGHNGGTSLAADAAMPPYTITASAMQYNAGQTITVTVAGSTSFKGLFLQARRVSGDVDTPVGTFGTAPVSTQLLTCNNVANSAWGHSDATLKMSLNIVWNAPLTDEGPIKFKATVVKGPREIFYLNVVSAELAFAGTMTTDKPASAQSGGMTAASTQSGGMTDGTVGTTPDNDAVDLTTRSSGRVGSISLTLAAVAFILGVLLTMVPY